MPEYKFGAVGATGLAEGTFGWLQSFSSNESGEEISFKDAEGNVAGQDVINIVEELSCEYVLDTTKEASLPSVGDVMEVGTNNFRVMSKGKPEDNGSYRKVSLSLKRYVNNSIPAAPAV